MDYYLAALQSENLKEYDKIIREIFESGEPVSLSKICAERDKFANAIVNEVGFDVMERIKAFEYAHKLVTLIDMTMLKDSKWIDDTEY